MLTVGPYPPESLFYSYHLIISFVTLGIFLVIIYLLFSHGKKQHPITRGAAHPNPTPQEKKDQGSKLMELKGFSTDNWLSLGSLIVTLMIAMIAPFVQLPILDYNTSNPVQATLGNVERVDVTITNYGIVAAKHVMVSLQADNFKFLGFTSKPLLSTNLNSSISTPVGHGLVGLDVVPPRASFTITADLSPSNKNVSQELITYLRSDETVGYHNVIYMVIFYAVLGLAYIIFFMLFWTGKLSRIPRNITLVGIIFGLYIGIVGGLIFYNSDLILNWTLLLTE